MKEEYSDGIFSVSSKHGFLPIFEPLHQLPEKYKNVQMLINDLDKSLLKESGLIEYAIATLDNMVELVKMEDDKRVLQGRKTI